MKTLKSIKEESRKLYAANAATYFSKSFSKKMGGTQIITFENDFLPAIELDKREYYTGRGAKYNSDSMHEHINVFVSKEEFEAKVNYRSSEIYTRLKEKSNAKKVLKNFCQINSLNASYYSGVSGQTIFFEKNKRHEIEAELKIDLSDFFEASGKTYYFADSKIGLLMFYHNHNQSYSFDFVTEEKRQEFLNDRENWVNAPYAEEVGNKPDNLNLYAC